METSEESPENGVTNANSTEDPAAMAVTRKFLFDTVFDFEEPSEEDADSADEKEEEEEEAEPEVIVPTFSEEEMKAAREESFAAGKTEGINEAAEATERHISASLEKLNQQFDGLFKAQEAADAAITETAISVASSIARKAFPALNQKGALAEIERMAVMAMEKILEEPEIIISINPELESALNERLNALKGKAAYKGEVKINADAGIALGDCRMEWSNGGAKRDMDTLWQDIDEIVERNLSENQETPPDTTTDTTTDSGADGAPVTEPGDASGDVGDEVSGEAPLEETPDGSAPEQTPETDQEIDKEPQPGSPPDLPEETPEPSGDEDTPTDQEDT